ncbi:MAG TPA: alpha/beta hydrolase [Anaerolineales bacterium]|nr:alpha/beta hydrolase [Anaerolineales bacterium]
MNDQNQIGATPNSSKRRGRGCLLWLGAGLASFLGLMLAGYIYERMAEAADAKAYPPPGQLMDVGGYRLHLNCTGTGSPTVIIDAGLGDWSTTWGGYVQPEVAKSTRVCTYDRAGLGWSEAGPLPRDAVQAAKELHTLLQNARLPGPYVMVGHSLGGFDVRVFVNDYSSEVAGIVLVDSMNPKQIIQSPTEAHSQPESRSQPFSLQAALARFGVVRLITKVPGIAPSVSPNEEAYYPLYVRPQSLQATTSEFQGLPAAGAQAAAVRTFGDLPLIILTAKMNNLPGWPEWQTELLQLSSNSQQLFAENSGHNIQIDEPEAAVAAILKMVELVRSRLQM